MNALDSTSTRPYLIRALYEWCTDNGLTPYVAVAVDDSVQVPREYVKNNEIVLNISFDATSSLKLGNDFIEFKARFAGSARDIMVPMARVIAIYARENGQGMAFPMAGVASGGTQTPAPAALLSAVPPVEGSHAGNTGAPTSGSAQLHVLHGPESKIVQLVPEGSALVTGNDDVDPPEPPKPAGTRPALKRVK